MSFKIAAYAILPMIVAMNAFAVEEGAVKNTRMYADIGRINWKFFDNDKFMFAVPHFTSGPRVFCVNQKDVECEVIVLTRDFTISDEQRAADLVQGMREQYRIEPIAGVSEYGENGRVKYLSAEKTSGLRVVVGQYINRPAVIQFKFQSRDQEAGDAALKQVLRLVDAANLLDANEFMALKFSDMKEACNFIYPNSKKENDSAFQASRLSKVDYVPKFAEIYSNSSPEELDSMFEQAKINFIGMIQELGEHDALQYCGSFSVQLREADRGVVP